ncbi:MAG: hypothetical protein ACERKT_09705, partial [Acidobacteriota bacterium]
LSRLHRPDERPQLGIDVQRVRDELDPDLVIEERLQSETGVAMHDMNCGFKAYRGECARSIDVYGEMHRFMPVLASQQGWKVAEIPVNHRAREHGKSRFGLERYFRGGLDLVTVTFLGRYQYRPLHLFGGTGAVLTFFGALILLYLTIVKIGGEPIGDRPLLFLGVLLIVVGVQLLTLGLLGQMLVVTRSEVAGPDLDRGRIEAVLEPLAADRQRGGSKEDSRRSSEPQAAEPAPAEPS